MAGPLALNSRHLRLGALLACLVACGSAVDQDGVPPDGPGFAVDSTGRGAVLPLPKNVIPVPLIEQQTDYSCGDVATLAILRYWKNARYKDVPETALYGPLHTTEQDGTEPQPIADYLDHEPGLHAQFRSSAAGVPAEITDLQHALDEGDPTIVDLQAWQDVPSVKDLKPWVTDWADGHYVVLIGRDGEHLYFMDPSTPRHYAYIPEAEFRDRWHDTLGPDNVHVWHMAVFVQSSTSPFVPDKPLPNRVTIIN